MPQVQLHEASLINVMTLFVTLLCVSQVYASCTEEEDSTYCTPTVSTPTIVGLVIGGIVLVIIVGTIARIYLRRRLRQRAAYMPEETTTIVSARTRPPTMPSPTHHSYPNKTPHVSPPSSPDSTRLPGGSFQPPDVPISHSPPSTHSQVSADPSAVRTPSISVTPAAYPPPQATSGGHSSLPENMEMHPLTVKTGVANDEPPPAYTAITLTE